MGGTVNTTQQRDYMASLYRANGDILSAGDSSGWHVACAGFAVKRIIERFEKDGGIYDETWRVVLTLTKNQDRLLFDFTGSDKQAKRGINLPYHATFGACYEGLLSTLAYDIPKNHGAFWPIEVVAPEGTVVNVYKCPV